MDWVTPGDVTRQWNIYRIILSAEKVTFKLPLQDPEVGSTDYPILKISPYRLPTQGSSQ